MIVSTRMLYHYLSAMPMSHWFHELSYPCNARNPSLCLQYLFILFTTVTITAAILLLLLLFYYCHHYKTVATDKPLRARLFPGAAKLTTHLLRLTYIFFVSPCVESINLGNTSLEDCCDPLYLWVITQQVSTRIEVRRHQPLWSKIQKIAITWSSTPTSPCILIVHTNYA
jgi:hypothetical protein